MGTEVWEYGTGIGTIVLLGSIIFYLLKGQERRDTEWRSLVQKQNEQLRDSVEITKTLTRIEERLGNHD